ncbi:MULTISPECIES: hypothetical protein [Staphylococcus]|uniref:Uncharacterized protein n=2 Tax=root TaxID=1 RepID=A0A8B2ZNZ3_STAWA|nr:MULTISPECIES: hypothetical protein [Staphylococcus]ASN69091.1 hypothetical protein 3S9_50 [uncultured Caudovirales phage]EJE37707.1 hypothetical protein HMPREF1389_06069 [Staphylococcus epidermidis NIH06004]KKI61652.1 hypothetical protein UF68_0754 [Staphylococcus warneri]MCF7595773.1 hypothetical protein [Staphylococcus warneri]MCK6087825.1 hypothetical protein [Staphylococcus warneri]
MDEKTRINEAYERLEKEGLNFKEDKAIFKLKDGTMEIYFDEEEKTIKTEFHDMNVFVSDELKDIDTFEVLKNLV